MAQSGTVLAFERVAGGEALLVALNFGGETENNVILPDAYRGTVLLSSMPGRAGEAIAGRLTLRPHEGLIISPDS